jgi:hypothetical protein
MRRFQASTWGEGTRTPTRDGPATLRPTTGRACPGSGVPVASHPDVDLGPAGLAAAVLVSMGEAGDWCRAPTYGPLGAGRRSARHLDDRNTIADHREHSLIPLLHHTQLHQLLKEGLVNQMSFAYDVWDEQRATDGANELRELDLIEAGPTLRGANDQADPPAFKANASEDVARVRLHLKTSHAGLTVDVGQRNLSDLLTLHRLVHAEIPCSPAHLSDATTDAGVEVTTAGKQELDL